MKYNPETHHRKSIRLKYYDYSNEGMYFITICTQNRKEILGKIINNQNKLKINQKSMQTPVGADSISAQINSAEKIMQKFVGADDPVRPKKDYNINPKIKLTKIGTIVQECWKQIDKIYNEVETDEFIIMPNHIHGIIIIKGRTGSSAPTKDYARI